MTWRNERAGIPTLGLVEIEIMKRLAVFLDQSIPLSDVDSLKRKKGKKIDSLK
jgi:hypothetical protein